MPERGAGRARVGRPRVNPLPSNREPVEEILFQAGRLFSRQGFDATSTREIAAASGFQQGSIYHYFPTKEDILVALIERSVRPFKAALQTTLSSSAPPPVKLYRLVYDLARIKFSEPQDIMSIVLQKHIVGDRFAGVRRDIASFTSGLEEILSAGSESGDFVPMESRLVVPAVLGIVNWPSMFIKRSRKTPSDGVGHELAQLALRSVSVGVVDVEQIAAHAMQIGEPDRDELAG
jgi:AcrR family transcriptional regulator